jgi:WD40 repeat protein
LNNPNLNMMRDAKVNNKVCIRRVKMGAFFISLFLFSSPVYSVWKSEKVTSDYSAFDFDRRGSIQFMHSVIYSPSNDCKPVYKIFTARPKGMAVHETRATTREIELQVDDMTTSIVASGSGLTIATENMYGIAIGIDGSSLPTDIMQGQRLYLRIDGSELSSVSLAGSSAAMKAAYQLCLKELEVQPKVQAPSQLNSDAPSKEPILRLNPKHHTAKIMQIASDAQGRWLATASLDKTLRLWDASNGDLLHTWRLPIGYGDEGELYAVAMDPAGAWLAVGGKTGYGRDNKYYIYILDRISGRMLKRLHGFTRYGTGEVLGLCTSADGRWLAASTAVGMSVYDAKDGFKLHFGDGSISSRSCSFSPDGQRLVTSTHDGNLNLYNINIRDFKVLAQTKPTGGKMPRSVSFHPDGDRIAVGFSDTIAVQVVDGYNLNLLYAADTTGLDNGFLGSVAWSDEGSHLFAGGSYDDGSGNDPVLSWSNSGRGQRIAWPAMDDTVLDLKSLPDGRLAVGTSDPALLVFDHKGHKLIELAPDTVDMRGKFGNAFLLSSDGQQLAFGLKEWGEEPVWFDLRSRSLQRGDFDTTVQIQSRLTDLGYTPGAINGQLKPKTRVDRQGDNDIGIGAKDQPRRIQQFLAAAIAFRSPNDETDDNEPLVQAIGTTPLSAPRYDAPGLNITGVIDDGSPSVNGKLLALKQNETPRSYAIAPDERRFLLGTEWYLRLFDEQGKELWHHTAPEAWGVNISGDGRLAVAAFGDGTFRWYRLSDGEPLLSLFVTNDGKNWVLWTPSGYYDASPGGDSLIGWHFNNGKEKVADFFPAAQMRGRFYRPEVIANILTELDESKALAKVGESAAISVAQGLPPTVELLSPENGSHFSEPQVTLRYRILSKDDAPISGLRLLIDGRPVNSATQRGIKRIKKDIQSISITLPERNLELALIAENRYGSSVPITASLIWDGRKASPGEFVIKPRLYVLAIGVSDYDDDALDLQFAAKDASDFAEALKRQGQRLYRDVVVKILTNAKSDAILDGLDWLRNEVTSKDVAMLFLDDFEAQFFQVTGH